MSDNQENGMEKQPAKPMDQPLKKHGDKMKSGSGDKRRQSISQEERANRKQHRSNLRSRAVLEVPRGAPLCRRGQFGSNRFRQDAPQPEVPLPIGPGSVGTASSRLTDLMPRVFSPRTSS